MPVATVTSKGQITIPKQVREHLDVNSGDKLEFRIDDDGTVRVVPITTSAAEAFGAFAHKAGAQIDDDEARSRVADHLRRKVEGG